MKLSTKGLHDSSLEKTVCQIYGQVNGVSVHHLRTTFKLDCKNYCRDHGIDIDSATINDIEDHQSTPGLLRQKGKNIISKEDGKIGASYIDCLEGLENVGTATYMLSYNWSIKINDIIDSLVWHCKINHLNEKRTYIWVDFLCFNQHRVDKLKDRPVNATFKKYEERILVVKNILFILVPWYDPVYLSRLWCLADLVGSIKNDCNIGCIMPPHEIEKMFLHFKDNFSDDSLLSYFMKLAKHVRDAKASEQGAQKDLLAKIESEVGYTTLCDRINLAVRQFVNTAFLFKTNEWIYKANTLLEDGDDDVEQNVPKGVSVYWLKHGFLQEVKDVGLSEESTIYDIEDIDSDTYGVIRSKGKDKYCPHDGEMGAAYVDCLIGEDIVGSANLMLSYSWGNTIGDIVDTLYNYCTTNKLDPKEVKVWICCLCNNQWRIDKDIPTDIFLSLFRGRVLSVGHIICLMAPLMDPIYLKRLWCVFEYVTALENGCEVTIAMPPRERKKLIENIGNIDALHKTFSGGRVQDATATKPKDKELILKQIEEGLGYEHFNRVVNGKFRLWVRKTVLEEVKKWRTSAEERFLKKYAEEYPE